MEGVLDCNVFGCGGVGGLVGTEKEIANNGGIRKCGRAGVGYLAVSWM